MNDLEKYRSQIDTIDKNILALLAKRREVVLKVGEYKKQNNLEILQKNRWEEVLRTKKELAKKFDLDTNFVETIWNEIHKYSLKIEK
ncbi:chorismate mutase [Candidatus Gracilibacteria bacterium]|nr:chorismate mutase [Candidatus Gracilibacteria bacterium]